MPLYNPSSGGGASVSDTAYASSWDADTTTAPSKNAVYDKFEGLIHPGWKAANWYTPLYLGTTVNAAAHTINTIFYFPIYIPRRIRISDLGVHIHTASSGNNCKVAIYAHDPATNRPTGTPLAETGSISTTSTGHVSADITGSDVTLEAGMYWSAFWNDSGVVALAGMNRDSTDIIPTLLGSDTLANVINTSLRPIDGVTSAETYGTWPNAAGETFTENIGNNYGSVLFMKAS